MCFKRLAFAAFAWVVLWGVQPVLSAPLLAPHRAVYDLVLDNVSDRSGITALAGRMVYEFNGSACEGYKVNFRFVTRIDTADLSRMSDQQTVTFESGDGKNFDFETRSFVESSLDHEIKGSAKLEASGLMVGLESPEKQTLELQATQFPTHHLMELIEKAGKGETFYETTIFDGSEDADRVLATTVIIGKAASAEDGDVELPSMNELAKAPYWPVEIAYFDLSEEKGGESLPDYRISFKLHENGITRDLLMDYGDFAMRGKLVNLALLEVPKSCK